MNARPLVVLGVTGSIGRQTLDVADALGLEIAAMAARQPGEQLAELARAHPQARVVATGGTTTERQWFRDAVPNELGFGVEALVDLASSPHSIVVNALVGAAGLAPTMAALEAGNRLALANKESIVAAGPLVVTTAKKHSAELIPVDSEHSALFQLVDGRRQDEVDRLVLTASGGPFRGRSRQDLADVTPSEALAHPTWDMGRRISIDSATLVNKGLEVIEAHVLFGIPFDRIDVVIHPQSIVHSLVTLTDGSMLAHVGAADMRIPIQYALTHPHRAATGIGFGLAGRTLEFHDVDRATFQALDLAYAAGRQGGLAPCVYNAADEVAVRAFLDGRLGFLGIPDLIQRTLEVFPPGDIESIEHVLDADAHAREIAASFVAGAC